MRDTAKNVNKFRGWVGTYKGELNNEELYQACIQMAIVAKLAMLKPAYLDDLDEIKTVLLADLIEQWSGYYDNLPDRLRDKMKEHA